MLVGIKWSMVFLVHFWMSIPYLCACVLHHYFEILELSGLLIFNWVAFEIGWKFEYWQMEIDSECQADRTPLLFYDIVFMFLCWVFFFEFFCLFTVLVYITRLFYFLQNLFSDFWAGDTLSFHSFISILITFCDFEVSFGSLL